MVVLVNGMSMELSEGLTIEDLLVRLKVRREYMAVAVNREVAPKSQYAATVLHEGDRIEIVHPMGGG